MAEKFFAKLNWLDFENFKSRVSLFRETTFKFIKWYDYRFILNKIKTSLRPSFSPIGKIKDRIYFLKNERFSDVFLLKIRWKWGFVVGFLEVRRLVLLEAPEPLLILLLIVSNVILFLWERHIHLQTAVLLDKSPLFSFASCYISNYYFIFILFLLVLF
jgi:hypothetical protein